MFAAASVNVGVGGAGRHSVHANAFGGENVSIAAFERHTVRVDRTQIDTSQGQTVQLTASYGRLWIRDPTWRDGLQNSVPMKRGSSAEQVALAVMWLRSEHASYVTGTNVDVSGGG